ncbi:prepilin peptidase [Marinomonas ostreistagni]|uniref:prepilin peptidase n=1 Tax=Marinomonas ostreistagni TaxID=359209 RepID=UPI00194FCE26|nr:A24 family peptidase [Marinomonas ostreistagni]MBM6550261.1 prepilin peptidase [Marinomonas ostreistagni]
MWSIEPLLYALVSLCIGSAIGSLSWRWQQHAKRQWHQEARQILALAPLNGPSFALWHSRSYCPHCHHSLNATALIPLLSYAWLKGRCHHCHTPISLRYPIIEGLTLSCLLPLHGYAQNPLELVALTLLVSTLICAAIIDFESYWLPDSAHLVVFSCATIWLQSQQLDLYNHLFAGLVSLFLLLVLRGVYQFFRNMEAIGIGDAKLLAVLVYWQGPDALIEILLAASFLGLIFALIQRKTYSSAIPFGPFLIAASLLFFYLEIAL